MAILVTGGAGYIGSHSCVELLGAGYEVVVIDNLCNSSEESLNRVQQIADKPLTFYKGDVRDAELLDEIFLKNDIEAVIHFAGLKAVGESCQKPIAYYGNNIGSTTALLGAMNKAGCKKIVFSSSATVYGMNNVSPLKETMPSGGTTNPYGTTKWFIEKILQDVYASDNEWSIKILRYFNPIGAHKSGLIGENPNGIPNNLMPYISQVAVGKLPHLNVFGNDYDTPDGTGVRDYIHVVDLARGHVCAVKSILDSDGCDIINLGTGRGYSVLEVVAAFEKKSGVKIPYVICPRREGDLASCYADPSKALEKLGWKAQYDMDDMCEDTWRWQRLNPNGF